MAYAARDNECNSLGNAASAMKNPALADPVIRQILLFKIILSNTFSENQRIY